MILIALGANKPGRFGGAADTLRRAPHLLAARGIEVTAASMLYETAPIGPSGQASYINAVVAVNTPYLPTALLARLKAIEEEAGRTAGRRWGARSLDLDIVAYHRLVTGWRTHCLPAHDVPGDAVRRALIVPHPRLHLRPFVIRPLLDIDPIWHHPVSGESAFSMWQRLKGQAGGQVLRTLGPLWP